jgi:membrane-bound serine protease (ClpP class)
MLTTGVPGVRVGYSVIVPAVLSLAGIFLFLGRLALVAQRRRPVTGAEGLIGEQGSVLTAVDAGQTGQVRVHGEIWRATSAAPLTAGRRVRVTAIEDGLTLLVEPAEGPTSRGETP